MMMGTENNKSLTNVKVDKPSVPPGFVSLTSFTLARVPTSEVACNFACDAERSPTGSIPKIIDSEKFKSDLWQRPWILDSQLSHNRKESDSEHEMVISQWQPEDPHRPALEEVPVFHPTQEEFKETLKYVASLRQKAEHIGMCRIVPPRSWKPPCLTRENNVWENLKFETNIQLVNELQDKDLKTKIGGVQKEMKLKRRKVQVRCSKDGCSIDGCPNDYEVELHTESCISKSGPEMTLKAFEKYANDFKRQYFHAKDKASSPNANLSMYQEDWEPSVEDVEGEYWRIIENPSEEIEVLHSSKSEDGISATGFPVNHNSIDTPKYPEYLESGWNLNNTFKLRGSLLCYEHNETSASLLPQLSAGMCFSSVRWKVEEHHLYSLCYMHLGGPKIWYVVPGRYCYKFEKVVKKRFPQFLEHPELLYNNIPQLSPSTLISEEIPVYRCVQYPGEFVLIFPAAYNSQFNCGFCCSEAVNFTPFDWLPYGQHVIDIYSDQGRQTSISQDKMLLGAAAEAVKAQWQLLLLKEKFSDEIPWTNVCGKDGILTKALRLRVKHEAIKREYLCRYLESQKMEDNFDLHIKRECIICLYDLHFSAVGCSCSPGRYACLRHAKDLCSCSWTARFLLVRYEINELNILVEALEGKLDAVYKWAKQKLGLRMNSSKLKDAVQIPSHRELLASLKAAALSPVSPGFGSLASEKRRELMTQQASRTEQKDDDAFKKFTPDNVSREETLKYTDSKLANLTCNKRELEKSPYVRNDVVIIDEEDG